MLRDDDAYMTRLPRRSEIGFEFLFYSWSIDDPDADNVDANQNIAPSSDDSSGLS